MRLFYAINHGLAHPALDPLMVGASWLGYGAAVWLAAAVVLYVAAGARPAWRRTAAVLVAAIVVSAMLESGLKALVGRPRPPAVLPDVRVLYPATGFSFPSGHALVSFAAAALLWRLDRRLGAPALALAALIAFSRVYVGSHWPSDVLAGALLGWPVGALMGLAAARRLPTGPGRTPPA